MPRTLIELINKMSSFMGWLSGILICVLTCLLIIDVFMRFVLNSPVDWALDITELLQAAVAFLAASYVLKVGGHVNMSAIIANLGPAWKRRFQIINHFITAFTAGWMSYLSWSLFTKSLAISEQSFGLELPLAPWKMLVSLGFAFLCLQGLAMALGLWFYPDQFMAQEREGH